MKYHPRLGHGYMPDVKLRVQGVSGGYLVRTNSAGFRADREFLDKREPGTFRALLFGDSQTAGDGLSNSQRYSDRLEAAVANLQLDNCAISGSATDQQFLAYQDQAFRDHDLVVIAVYVENILRIVRHVVKAKDVDGGEVFRAKPYFQLKEGQLVLHHVPVPKLPWTEQTLPQSLRDHAYSFGDANYFFRNQSGRHDSTMRLLAKLPTLRRTAKLALTRWKKFQPMPAYDDPCSSGWLLMSAILTRWITESRAPVLIVPLPHDSSLMGVSDPSGYQTRFRELAANTGSHLFDPLPGLLQIPVAERQALWSDSYGHLSNQGHAEIARLLEPVFEHLVNGEESTEVD